MMRSGRFRNAAVNRDFYPFLVLLVLAVLLPTVCILWFMMQAMTSERLAVRQRLAEAYAGTLTVATAAARKHFVEKYYDHSDSGTAVTSSTSAEQFRELLETLKSDSVVLLDEDGRITYPDSGVSTEPGTAATVMDDAVRLEEELREYRRAADLYAQHATEAGDDTDLRAQALQAQARCLLKDGLVEEALDVLTGPLNDSAAVNARDGQGRLVQPSAQLLALELLKDATDSRFAGIARALTDRLNHYGPPAMSASQRLFLMENSRRVAPDSSIFPTLEAEKLARSWADADMSAEVSNRNEPLISRNDLWANPVTLLLPEETTGQAVALYKRETLQAEIRSIAQKDLPNTLNAEVFPPDAGGRTLSVMRQGNMRDQREPLLAGEIGPPLTGWTLALYPSASLSLYDEAGKRTSIYLWIGLLSIGAVAAVVMLGGHVLLRQSRLARLKNDLTATVTHELKTPISSMRLLVDTLRDDPECDEKQRSEYLELIARENARLSRLIDNFLTFSRMERNKHAFDLRPVHVKDVVDEAVLSAGEKFCTNGCRLNVQVRDDLPQVSGDRDALVTVLLNLLENAYKYTDENKEIDLLVYGSNGEVCMEVHDNGIGIPPREQKRIFERFYKADQNLSRQTEGCGLGLSIVKYIVAGHAGRVTVKSAPGKGSTFTVRLPVRGGTV